MSIFIAGITILLSCIALAISIAAICKATKTTRMANELMEQSIEDVKEASRRVEDMTKRMS